MGNVDESPEVLPDDTLDVVSAGSPGPMQSPRNESPGLTVGVDLWLIEAGAE